MLIYIDAGHGGSDPGAGSGNYTEKNLVLDLSNRLRSYLLNNFVCTVLMTRTTDKTLSLTERTNLANQAKADYLISVHFNAFTSTSRGYEDFTWNGISDANETGRIRNAIHGEVVERVLSKYNIPNRGKKKANFHMLRESNMPAILVETLFVSNAADQRLISQGINQDFAVAYGEGIGRGMGLTRKAIPVSAPAPTTGGLFRVQNGAFRSRANADALVSRLKQAGFPAYSFLENGLYKVQSGAFSSKTNAENLERRLRSAGFPAYIYRD